jgi:hypothetical protein
VDQTKGMDPQARSAYLISKLGERGAKLADAMTQAQTDQLTQTNIQLKNIEQGYTNTTEKINAQNAPAAAQLALRAQAAAIAKTQADTLEAGAAANSDNASAQASRAQAGYYGQEAAMDQQRTNLLLEGSKAVMAIITAGNTPAAATLLAGDPNHPSAPTGAPNPNTPPGAPPSVTDPTTAINQAATTLNYALGNASQQQLNAAYPPDNIQFTPGTPQKAAAAGDLAQGKIGDAMTDLNPVPTITQEQRHPGIYQNFATYPDGTSGWVGRPRVQFAPTPAPAAQAADGVSAWEATTGALSQLSALAPGSRITRQVQQTLNEQGIDAGDVPAAYAAVTAHAVIATEQLMGAGGSRGVTVLNMIKSTLPKYTDAPNIRALKLRAADALLSSIVKPIVGTLNANGETIPPAMQTYFNSHGLMNKSMTDLANEYVGISGDPDVGNGGDGSGNSGPGEGGEGDGAEGNPLAPEASTGSENGSNSSSQGAPPPLSAEEFDTQWATLKPGDQLTGPDGKTYTKQAQ